MRKLMAVVFVSSVFAIAAGCSKKESPAPAQGAASQQAAPSAQPSAAQPSPSPAADPASQAAQMAKAAQQMAEASKQMAAMEGKGPQGQPVDFHQLEALLPESIRGWKRTHLQGERTGAMGMRISTAEGSYSGDKDAELQVKLTDMAGVPGAMMMGMVGWKTMQIDRETDDGYEKTTMIGGNKAWEKWDSQSKDAQLKVIVADRFLVDLDGSNTTMDEMQAVLGKLDLGKLASLKAAGGK